MKTLSDIEIEDILAGRATLPDDADEVSRAKLADAKAIRRRLQQACTATAVPQGLAESIRQQIAAESSQANAATADRTPPKTRVLTFPHVLRRVAPGIAAAALIAVAIGVWVLGGGTERAYAQPELAAIHHVNAEHGNNFQPCRDGSNIARRLRENCGQRIDVPNLPRDCRYAGSTLAKFRDATVASAVIESDDGPISVITLQDRAESLGFGSRRQRGSRTFMVCMYDNCRMAALDVDGVTFVATGEVSHDQLLDILEAFAAANAPQQ